MPDNYNIQRFIQAQELYNSYNNALSEIQNGRKLSHWIWYVFPQMKGLGHSRRSNYYGISSLEEARAYLGNDILKSRPIEICNALLLHSDKTPREILGVIDAHKVKSSMTLFDIIAPNEVFGKVLSVFYNGSHCMSTLEILDLA